MRSTDWGLRLPSLASLVQRRLEYTRSAAHARHLRRCDAGRAFLWRKPQQRAAAAAITVLPTLSKYEVSELFKSRGDVDVVEGQGVGVSVIARRQHVPPLLPDRTPHVGMCTKKKILGNLAVHRRRARVLVRPIAAALMAANALPGAHTVSAFRSLLTLTGCGAGVDYVVVPSVGSLFLSHTDLWHDVHAALHRLGTLFPHTCSQCAQLGAPPFYLQRDVFPPRLLRDARADLAAQYAVSLFSAACHRGFVTILFEELTTLRRNAERDPALKYAINLKPHDQQRVHHYKKLIWKSNLHSKLFRNFIRYTIRRGHLMLFDEIFALFSYLVEEGQRQMQSKKT